MFKIMEIMMKNNSFGEIILVNIENRKYFRLICCPDHFSMKAYVNNIDWFHDDIPKTIFS